MNVNIPNPDVQVPVDDIVLAGVDKSVEAVQELNCDELSEMFSSISLDDILSMPNIKMPKVDLSGMKFDIEMKFKFDDMFKNFSIKFPDMSLPNLDFEKMFDWIANKLELPKIDELKMPPNPLEGLGEKAEELLKEFTKCDKFKTNIVNPGVGAMDEMIKPKMSDYI